MKFMCGYCGKSYNNVEDGMACENNCRNKYTKKVKSDEMSKGKKDIADLRQKESALVAKLQAVREEIKKIENKIKRLEDENAEGVKSCGCGCKHKVKSTYSINGNEVGEEQFYDELDRLFGNIFNF